MVPASPKKKSKYSKYEVSVKNKIINIPAIHFNMDENYLKLIIKNTHIKNIIEYTNDKHLISNKLFLKLCTNLGLI